MNEKEILLYGTLRGEEQHHKTGYFNLKIETCHEGNKI